MTMQEQLLLDRLKQLRAEGKLGVLAARSNVPEWVIRDWCDNAMHTPNREEVQKLQEALDNRKREAGLDVPCEHEKINGYGGSI